MFEIIDEDRAEVDANIKIVKLLALRVIARECRHRDNDGREREPSDKITDITLVLSPSAAESTGLWLI